MSEQNETPQPIEEIVRHEIPFQPKMTLELVQKGLKSISKAA